jgi:iron-sulfur cluster assembly accessory protein
MIDISEKAKEYMKGIADAEPGKVVFLGIKGGGCAGFSYDWSLKAESELDEYSDEVIDLENGTKLAIDGTSLMYLYGSQINLKQDLFGTVLEISSPSAQSSCGCGESINFDMEKVETNMSKVKELKIPE